MQKIVIFGKGGIGKSTVTVNLAVTYAQKGLRVLVVGCDPKHDTTVALTGGRMIPTVVAAAGFRDGRVEVSDVVVRGRLGIDCVEAGGPEPGVGCAGRGISRMAEILEAKRVIDPSRYDVVLFDVLGDVVCGGFAAPLRQGFAEKVVIVTSEESMSLYAANNICRAVRTYLSNGISLLGLVANLRSGADADADVVRRFAALAGTRVLANLTRNARLFREGERRSMSVCELYPGSIAARRFRALAEQLLVLDPTQASVPAPLSDEEFFELSRVDFAGGRGAVAFTGVPATPTPGPVEATAAAAAVVPRAEEEDIDLRVAADDPVLDVRSGAGQWGDRERWRLFFADREFERNREAGARFSGPILWLQHGDIECRYSTPSFDEGLVSFLNLPCVPAYGELVRTKGSGDYGSTNLCEADVIGGGLEALDAALRGAEERGAEMIVINATCVPLLIGDDGRMLIERAKKRSKIEFLYNSPASGQPLDMAKALFDRLRRDPAFMSVTPAACSVNLLGFPPGKGTEELCSLLAAAGVEVNLALLPFFDYEEARRFRRGGLQVLYPAPERRELYASLLNGEPTRAISPPAPYGLEGTRRWLRVVCQETGADIKRAEAAFEDARGAAAADWEDARARTAGRRLAFVFDAPRLRRLLDEGGVAGVPLFDVLREGGFGLDFLIYKPHESASARAASDERVKTFSNQEELTTLLRAGRFDAVYSEFFFDDRLTSAGKAQFSLPMFSMGAAGAARTLDRLASLCGWPFYRRYASVWEGHHAA